ncbi:MAG TPA: hypothetical protein VGC51_00590 [Hansschlegelia sp.]
MTRHAGRLALLALAGVAALGPARAADHILGSETVATCAPAETVTTSFEEQVCYLGPSGYEACRWLPRQHIVTIPSTCSRDRAVPYGLVRK